VSEEQAKRKLAAILSADAKDYSRLMEDDEEATVRTITAYRELMVSQIQNQNGRVVDAKGDNLLAEFSSVVDAVRCAVEIQKELGRRNDELPEHRKMEFRIGVNLGDVIEEGETIYGDGVNIAARLEALAEGGGICISGTAFDQIRKRLTVGYEYLGEQAVKNIETPVRVYRVLTEPEAAGKVIGEEMPRPKHWRWAAIGGVAVLIILAGAFAIWNFYLRPPFEPASVERMAFPLPDKPSIAVLPFSNMSDDPKQEYFSDGITEDLITDLSGISGLFVIARNSTFAYKGKPAKIGQVAEELGVRYVLEGSVRKAGNHVRINAQLIDASTGHQLWAKRYDGKMGDVFALQDKITQKIVAALAVKLTEVDRARIAQKWTNNPEAYDEYLKGREHNSRITVEDYDKAEARYMRALELDPKFSQARAALASLYFHRANFGLGEKGVIAWFKKRLWAAHYLRQAMSEPTSLAYRLAGHQDLFKRNYDAAISQLEKALSLDPNDPDTNGRLSWALSRAGRPAEALEYAKKAMRLDPINPDRFLAHLGMAQFCLGNLEEAASLMEKVLKANPEWFPPSTALSSFYGLLGRNEEARAALENAYKGFIRLPADVRAVSYFYPFKDRRIADSFAEGLIKAGLPGRVSDYIHVSKQDQITGDDLRSFLYPSSITGFRSNGSQWSIDFAKDGTVTGLDTGRSWLEGDEVCFQFQKLAFGMVYCGTTFKNPRGTFERKNEYVRFNDIGMITFSRLR
jgi:TolB-like protein/class 3 adenylate cyclase/cytochrome c-type biogenesis protein CcmH/NrfG